MIAEGTYTLPEVIAEVVYVLKGVYKVGRDEISNTLIDFMDEVAIDNQEVITWLFHYTQRLLWIL